MIVCSDNSVYAAAFQLPKILQKGELPILDNRNCARRFARPPVQVEIFDSMLCAAEESGGVDTCQVRQAENARLA